LAAVLPQYSAVPAGAGEDSVILVSGSDTLYVVYYRRPLGTMSGNRWDVCIGELRSDADGTIRSVQITFDGVRARRVPAPRSLRLQPGRPGDDGHRGDHGDSSGSAWNGEGPG
jgi:hypothetical protein